jgi:hypothetical protein
MADWKAFCANYYKTYQPGETAPQPGCTNGVKTNAEILTLAKSIGELTAQVNTTPTGLQATSVSTVVDNTINSFCCTMMNKQDLQTKLVTAREEYNVAKIRADNIQNPANDVSNRGTRFPFGRPLRPEVAPILLLFTFAFMILSFGMLLTLGNVHIVYATSGLGMFAWVEQLKMEFQSLSWGTVGTTVGLSAAAAIGIFYAIVKTRPQWLGL